VRILAGGVLAVALRVRGYVAARQERAREPEIPVEWWGVRRPWQAEDEKVLDRAIIRG
jgi:branched-chain amino acid transport system permease protein